MRDIEKERNDLLVRVARGEVTPKDAEAEAEREKLGPLAGVRDPDRFNPFGEDRWTNPMVVSWIRWRDTERVRRQMEGYRAELKKWERRGKGHVLVPMLSKAQVTELKLDQDGEDFSYFADAQRDLWTRLKNSELAAVGIDRNTSRPVTIPAAEWVYLTLWGKNTRKNTRPNSVAVPPTIRLRGYHRRLPREMQKIRYDDINVSREDVLRLWPMAEPPVGQASLEANALKTFIGDRYQSGIPFGTTDSKLARAYSHWAKTAPIVLARGFPRTLSAQFIGRKRLEWGDTSKPKRKPRKSAK